MRVFRSSANSLEFGDANVASFNVNLLEAIAQRLGLQTRFVRSSELSKLESLMGQSRVIDICRAVLGATRYVNPIGGSSLYEAEAFDEHGIALRFPRKRRSSRGRSKAAPFDHSCSR